MIKIKLIIETKFNKHEQNCKALRLNFDNPYSPVELFTMLAEIKIAEKKLIDIIIKYQAKDLIKIKKE